MLVGPAVLCYAYTLLRILCRMSFIPNQRILMRYKSLLIEFFTIT